MKLFVAVVMFVMVPLVCVAEQSPHPLPSPGKESQPIQNSSQDEQQKIDGNNRPTEQPSTFINQTETPQTTQVKPNRGSNPDQSTPDDWIVWLTGALVFVGITQVVVYVIQARYMSKGLDVTRQSAKAAQDSADAALLGATAAKESAVIARETLQVTQRAYLGVEVGDWRFKYNDAGIPIRIECVFYNSGATPAEVIGSHFVVYEVDVIGKLPPPPDYSHVPIDSLKPKLMHAGGGYTESVMLEDLYKEARLRVPVIPLIDMTVWRDGKLKSVLQGTTPFYVGGYMVYKTLGLYRLFVFLAEYEAAPLDRFVSVGESAYNYEIPYDAK
jgi:hypothetical protein